MMETTRPTVFSLPAPGPAAGSPVQRACDGIRLLIQEHGWEEGRRLPAEEALAERFQVSRSTLRKALDELARHGWVRRQRNRGCVVTAKAGESSRLFSSTLVVAHDLVSPPAAANRDDGSAGGVQQGMIDAAGARDLNALFVPIAAAAAATATRRLLRLAPPGLAMLCWRRGNADARRLAARFHEAGTAVVAYGMDECPEAVARYDRVISDHESGMRQLLELLARNGRRRALRIWTVPRDAPWIAAHDRAYDAAAREFGMEPLPAVYTPPLPERREGDRAVFEMRTRVLAGYLAEHFRRRDVPDAIMLGTDCEVFPAAAACRLLGLAPGEDVLVTGYDNYWLAAFERRFEPAIPFATVDKRNPAIGAEMIRLLTGRIAGGSAMAPRLSKVAQVAVQIQGAPSPAARRKSA